MRHLFLLLAVLFVIPLFGSDSPKEYDDRVEMVDSVEGSWLLVSEQYKGRVVIAEETRKGGKQGVTFQGGEFTRIDPKEDLKGTYTTNTARKPAQLDMAIEGGLKVTYIYRRDGDKLLLGVIWEGGRRPKSFDDKGIYIETYKRVKK